MDHDDVWSRVAERLDRLEQENAQLKAELADLRNERTQRVERADDTVPAQPDPMLLSRRTWLARGAVVAGAVATGAMVADRAAAANGVTLTLGGTFTGGTSTTQIASNVPAPTTAEDVNAAFKATNTNGTRGTGLYGDGSSYGTIGYSPTGVGVFGAASGAFSPVRAPIGVRGYALDGFGGQFESPWADLVIGGDIARQSPLLDGDRAHTYGEMVAEVDHATFTATLWFCTATGVPGTWRRMAGAGTAGALTVLPAPVRVYDTRPGLPPLVGVKTPLAKDTDRIVDCTLNSSGVPNDAVAVLLNVTIANPSAAGNVSVRAAGAADPTTSNLNFVAGQTIANSVTAACGPVATIALRLTGATAGQVCNAIVDVVGYYR